MKRRTMNPSKAETRDEGQRTIDEGRGMMDDGLNCYRKKLPSLKKRGRGDFKEEINGLT